MAWHYARTFLSEPLVMLCLIAALGACLAYLQEKKGYWGLLAGFALGLAVATRSFNLLVIPFFALYLFVTWWQNGRKVWEGLKLGILFSLPLLGWLLVILWWNWARFGTPFETGYGSEAESFNTPLFKGLYGLLFSPGKSIFLYNPVLIPALAGFPALWQRRFGPGLIFLTGGVVLVYLSGYSLWHDWHGGGVWGPRFLLPILPFLLLGAASLLELLTRLNFLFRGVNLLPLALTFLFTLSLILSLIVQLLSVVISYQIYATLYKDEIVFRNMVFNPPDSPIIKHFQSWVEGERPDFSPRFYHDTPFARFTGTFQSLSWLLFLGLLIFGLLVFLKLRRSNLEKEKEMVQFNRILTPLERA